MVDNLYNDEFNLEYELYELGKEQLHNIYNIDTNDTEEDIIDILNWDTELLKIKKDKVVEDETRMWDWKTNSIFEDFNNENNKVVGALIRWETGLRLMGFLVVQKQEWMIMIKMIYNI